MLQIGATGIKETNQLVAARLKAHVAFDYSTSPTAIVGSNSSPSMDICCVVVCMWSNGPCPVQVAVPNICSDLLFQNSRQTMKAEDK
jgi:hypothetical protein